MNRIRHLTFNREFPWPLQKLTLYSVVNGLYCTDVDPNIVFWKQGRGRGCCWMITQNANGVNRRLQSVKNLPVFATSNRTNWRATCSYSYTIYSARLWNDKAVKRLLSAFSRHQYRLNDENPRDTWTFKFHYTLERNVCFDASGPVALCNPTHFQCLHRTGRRELAKIYRVNCCYAMRWQKILEASLIVEKLWNERNVKRFYSLVTVVRTCVNADFRKCSKKNYSPSRGAVAPPWIRLW